jgi:hypothetical protein
VQARGAGVTAQLAAGSMVTGRDMVADGGSMVAD